MTQADVGPTDVGLISWPRSGSTWLRFMLANTMARGVVSFRNIDEYSPYAQFYHESMEVDYGFPRIIKSHWLPDKLDFAKNILLVRHPCAAVHSYWRAFTGVFLPDVSFKMYVKNVRVSHPSMDDLVTAWHERGNQLVVYYENLIENPGRELAVILDFLGISVEPARFDQALANTTIDIMRELEATTRDGMFKYKVNLPLFVCDGHPRPWEMIEDTDWVVWLAIEKKHPYVMENFNYEQVMV